MIDVTCFIPEMEAYTCLCDLNDHFYYLNIRNDELSHTGTSMPAGVCQSSSASACSNHVFQFDELLVKAAV